MPFYIYCIHVYIMICCMGTGLLVIGGSVLYWQLYCNHCLVPQPVLFLECKDGWVDFIPTWSVRLDKVECRGWMGRIFICILY
ncbi:hypothetical protein F383_24100 [Gossypium arboreum]|uniref:Uncharacterized protein n=1 Tax=Gossypium arboreum TaxID=29729 RepID=A0A0B0P590_GOSAR|nr:hypothetical protein F383_24100 [Gossypium arboreum]